MCTVRIEKVNAGCSAGGRSNCVRTVLSGHRVEGTAFVRSCVLIRPQLASLST